MTNGPRFKIGDKVYYIKKDNRVETRDCLVSAVNVNYWKKDAPPIVEYDIILNKVTKITVGVGVREDKVAGSLEELKDILLKMNGLNDDGSMEPVEGFCNDKSFLSSEEYGKSYWHNKYSDFTYKLKRVEEYAFKVESVVHFGMLSLDESVQEIIASIGDVIEIEDLKNDIVENYSNTRFYERYLKDNWNE